MRLTATALAVLALLGVCLIPGAPSASAALASAGSKTGPVVALTPLGRAHNAGYFVFTGRSRRVIHGSLAVSNVSRTTAGTIRLAAVDATTGQTTGAAYLSTTANRRDVGRWLHLSAHRVRLGPDRRTVVRFTVRVPRHARAGQHLGAIVAEPAVPVRRYDAHRHGSRFEIKVQALTVLAVQVDVRGHGAARQRMAISGCRVGGQHRYQTLFLGLRNSGNMLLKGSGRVTVATQAGHRLQRRRFRIDTFVPQTQIAYPLVLTGHPLPTGRYRTTIALSYGRRHHAHRTVTCTVSHKSVKQVFGSVAGAQLGGGGTGRPSTWLLVLGGVAVFAVGFGGAAMLFRTRLRGRPGA